MKKQPTFYAIVNKKTGLVDKSCPISVDKEHQEALIDDYEITHIFEVRKVKIEIL